MSVLIVVAHPDDEVLALGGAAHALGGPAAVHTCIACAGVEERRGRPADAELAADMARAHEIAGMTPGAAGDFPNLAMNTVPHVRLVQFVEAAIAATGATRVFTHHPADLNDDHRQVSRACQAAVRLFQRRPGVAPLVGFYYVEVPSATDWAFPGDTGFRPTGFIAVGAEGVERKIEAVNAYRGVLRDYPHPRSAEAIRGLAARRGAQAGIAWAEAVEVVFERLA